MGMRIGGSQQNWAVQNQSVSHWQQRQSGLKDVMKALQSADLAGAQKAFSSLNIDTSSMDSSSPMAQLSSALQSGDLPGAQKAAQTMGHHRHHGGAGSVQDKGTAQAASDPMFMQLVAQSLTTTLSQSQNNTNTANTGTSATASTPVAASTDTASQALASFMQNLMSALSTQTSGANAASDSDGDGDRDGGQGFRQMLNAAGTAGTTGSTQSALSSLGNMQGPPSPRFQSYMQAMGGQMRNNLDNLLQQLSSSNAATGSTSGTTAGALQNSFGNFVTALGGQADSASLTSFLKTLENNLQLGGTSGNLLNVSA